MVVAQKAARTVDLETDSSFRKRALLISANTSFPLPSSEHLISCLNPSFYRTLT